MSAFSNESHLDFFKAFGLRNEDKSELEEVVNVLNKVVLFIPTHDVGYHT